MDIIDAGTITQESTDDAPPPCGPTGPVGPTIDAGTITSASTNDASPVGPTPARWPSQDL